MYIYVVCLRKKNYKGGNIYEYPLVTPTELQIGRSIRDLQVALNAGITSVRDVGGLGQYLSILSNEKSFIGPNIYYAGKILSITGGHGDVHSLPVDFVQDYCPYSMLVDDISECIKGVRMNLRNGCHLIKIHCSGGVLSQLDNPQDQQFNDLEIQAIVQEAKRVNRIVAAHCHGKLGIIAAIRNGCQTLEHCSFLDNECIELIKKQTHPIIIVPTRWIMEEFVGKNIVNVKERPNGLTDFAFKKACEIYDQHFQSMKLAIQNQIPIAMGTDMLMRYGSHAEELQYYVQAGMTNLQAIESATANGPLTLGPQAPLSGQIKEGYDADLIGLYENPLNDISILSQDKNIILVWKNGELVKDLR